MRRGDAAVHHWPGAVADAVMGDAATSVRGRRAAGAVERRRHRYGPVAVWPGLEGDRGTRHWSGTVVDRRRPAIAGRAQGIEQRPRPTDVCGTAVDGHR